MDQDLIADFSDDPNLAGDPLADALGAEDHGTPQGGVDASGAKDPMQDPAVVAAIERIKLEAQNKALSEALDRVGRPQPSQPSQPQYTAEQVKAYNERIVNELSTNPLEFLEKFKQNVMADALAQLQTNANPALATAGDMYVESFLTRATKAMPPKLAEAVAEEFDSPDDPLDRASLVSLPTAQRNATLKRRLEAAVGRVSMRNLGTRTQTTPRGINGGGGSSPAATGTPLQQYARIMGYSDEQARRSLKVSFPHIKEEEAVKMMLAELKESA